MRFGTAGSVDSGDGDRLTVEARQQPSRILSLPTTSQRGNGPSAAYRPTADWCHGFGGTEDERLQINESTLWGEFHTTTRTLTHIHSLRRFDV